MNLGFSEIKIMKKLTIIIALLFTGCASIVTDKISDGTKTTERTSTHILLQKTIAQNFSTMKDGKGSAVSIGKIDNSTDAQAIDAITKLVSANAQLMAIIAQMTAKGAVEGAK